MRGKTYTAAIMLLFLAVLQCIGAINVKVFLKDEAINEGNIIKPRIYIQNTGTEAVSNFSYYYYLTAEDGNIPIVESYWTPDCAISLENLGNSAYRIKYAYTGVPLTPGAIAPTADGNIIGIHYTGWSAINKLNDFSYTNTATFQQTNKIPVYNAVGILIYGTDPNGGVVPPPENPPVPLIAGLAYSSISEYIIYSATETKLSDRVTVTGGSIGSNGYLEVGCDSRIYGNVTSVNNVFFRERSRVEGTLAATGTVQKQNQVVVTGTITENAVLNRLMIPTVDNIPVGTTNITVQNNETKDLAPGTYNDIHVNANATLIMHSGIYNVHTLIFEPDVKIQVQTDNTHVAEINVIQEMRFGDRNVMSVVGNGGFLNIRIYSNQTTQFRIGTDSRICGIVTIPYGEVSCASRVILTGALYGNTIRIEPDVDICRPPLLSGLTHTHWAYSPTFDPYQITYTAVVPDNTYSLITTPKSNDAQAGITINGADPEKPVVLGVSETLVSINVSKNGACGTTQYSLNVKKQVPHQIFVNDNSPCRGADCDGTSWNRAYKDLQLGLNDAEKSGKEIWLAEGVYKPTVRLSASDRRSSTFLIKGGIEIIGGYKGEPDEVTPRGSAYNTVLSGDLDGNDTPISVWPPAPVDSIYLTDNAYHVVIIDDPSQVGSVTIGMVTIRNGVANGVNSDMSGGGIYIRRGQPSFNFCCFKRNISKGNGAGLFGIEGATLIKNCLFAENISNTGKGGGLYLLKGQNVTIEASVFDGNRATNATGGAFYQEGGTAKINNTIFVKNICNGAGAAIGCSKGVLTINSSTMTRNASLTNSGTISSLESQIEAVNSIFWDDTPVEFSGAGCTVTYSCIKNGFTGIGNISTDPSFTNSAAPEGADGTYGSTDDGLRLTTGSPCIDKGEQSKGLPMAIDGIIRPIGSGYDLGAYEMIPTSTTSNNVLGRLDASGNYIPFSITPVIDDLTEEWQIRIAAGSNSTRVIRLNIAKNKYLDNKSSFYANVIGRNADGSPIPEISSIRIDFFKIGATKDEYIYQSKTSTQGKSMLFVSNPALHGNNNPYAYVLYTRSTKIYYEVPGSQF